MSMMRKPWTYESIEMKNTLTDSLTFVRVLTVTD